MQLYTQAEVDSRQHECKIKELQLKEQNLLKEVEKAR